MEQQETPDANEETTVNTSGGKYVRLSVGNFGGTRTC